MNNILEKIVKKKNQRLEEIKKNVSIDLLKDKIAKNDSFLNFKEKISNNIKNNKISTSNKVDLNMLKKNKLIGKKYKKLKLLGSGDLKDKFDFEVNFISKSAKKKIEKLGGKINLIK